MAILTLSREYGTEGGEIGKAVAEAMGYSWLDRRGMFDEIRTRGKRWEKIVENLDDLSPSLWERYDWSYRAFVALNHSIALEHALKDRVVLIGREGAFLLSGVPHCLCVHVGAPFEQRLKRIMGKEALGDKNARLLVEKVDHEISKAVHLVYGKDWRDPTNYDRVFDMGKEERGAVIAEICDGLSRRDLLDTPEARLSLARKALAARILAAVASNPKYLVPTFAVEEVGEGLVLKGVVHGPDEKEAILKEAMDMAGDTPVTSELHYRGLIVS